MGLANITSVWKRMVDVLLEMLIEQVCNEYMNDVIIYTAIFKDHVSDMKNVPCG